jgi:hypothetical protein
MDNAERLQAHLRNIDRFQALMQTKLSATELRFVEQRLSEERFTVAMLQFMGGRDSAGINLPDALQ